MITEISEGGETAENHGEIGLDACPNEKAFFCVGDFQVCHTGDGSGNDECAENEHRKKAESVGAGDGESVENSYRKDIDLGITIVSSQQKIKYQSSQASGKKRGGG